MIFPILTLVLFITLFIVSIKTGYKKYSFYKDNILYQLHIKDFSRVGGITSKLFINKHKVYSTVFWDLNYRCCWEEVTQENIKSIFNITLQRYNRSIEMKNFSKNIIKIN
jgi:hypothetical protein